MVHYAAFGLLAPGPRPALRAGDPAGPQAALCHARRAFGLQRLLDLLPLQDDASTRLRGLRKQLTSKAVIRIGRLKGLTTPNITYSLSPPSPYKYKARSHFRRHGSASRRPSGSTSMRFSSALQSTALVRWLRSSERIRLQKMESRKTEQEMQLHPETLALT